MNTFEIIVGRQLCHVRAARSLTSLVLLNVGKCELPVKKRNSFKVILFVLRAFFRTHL